MTASRRIETATFAAGCFWGVEAAFRQLQGVVTTVVGYAGGEAVNPSYELVCTGLTGHAESVRINFDPSVITYDQLLEAFWATHDPTQVDRQGPDVGSQYRSVIFCHDGDQRQAAESSRDRLAAAGRPGQPVATEIVTMGDFYPAEDYHQQYLEKRGIA